ncbi:MAG TPA: glycoside hydrolase domain-containing protein, partial [Ilumatobacteraceae bacterium]|nr:glycoside hydrolase domain-containing protein [Ilumatobacteraceae bacterium]
SQLDALATKWVEAFDPGTGLLVDSTFYEGGRWNYSFRLMHDMAARIEFAGGEEAFGALLDRFFGVGAPAVKQLGVAPEAADVAAGYALDRFEGLNNEPDMEVPWAYHYIGRPDRTAEIVHAIVEHQFGTGRGGLPGNDDSGGLSSWYVWASLGLFPVAGQQIVFVNAPSFAHACIRVPHGTFTIDTIGFVEPRPDRRPQYVQSVTLDGVPLGRTWITTAELHRGGRLLIELGAQPTGWGSDDRPPSLTTRQELR